MIKLKKMFPPMGTKEQPLREHTYYERVLVVNGNAECRRQVTANRLVQMGYKIVGGKQERLESDPVSSPTLPPSSAPKGDPPAASGPASTPTPPPAATSEKKEGESSDKPTESKDGK